MYIRISKDLTDRCYKKKKKKKKNLKKSFERYQNISEEENKRKQEYGHERYKNLSDNDKNLIFDRTLTVQLGRLEVYQADSLPTATKLAKNSFLLDVLKPYSMLKGYYQEINS